MDSHDLPLLLDPLTDRELDVLRLMAEGFTNPEIADRLILGLETVRWYTKQIYSKLGVHSRTQASMRARDLGLLVEGDGAPVPPSGEITRHNLPDYLTPFFGRDAEISEISRLLRDEHVRLVTIAGPGGMGKTRLCVEVARLLLEQFPDGVHFVPLLAVRSPDGIEFALADRMHVRLRDDEEPREQLLRHLQPQRALLVLDNFEHLLSGADLITAVLAAAPHVKILVTSQASLNLREEWVRAIDALPLPGSDDEASGAIQLFYDRVRRVRGDFLLADHQDCVAHICRLVQGVPLAIELAAAWLKTLTCEDVAREIQHNLDFLATGQRDIEERHRSIEAVFEYAWNLLTPAEQSIFRRLSVFRGGFGLVAAKQIAGASVHTLSDLMSKSLLQQNAAGLYEIHDLLRQYAERKLETLDESLRTMRSSKLLVWSALIRGRLDKLQEVVEVILNASLDHSVDSEKGFALVALGVLACIEGDFERGKQLCEAGQPLVQSDPIASILSHFGLAIAGFGAEDYVATRRNARAALVRTNELRSPAFSVLCLPMIAMVLTHEAEPEQAVELLALTFTHPASTPGWMEKWPLVNELRGLLEAELGSQDYAAAWNRGMLLNLEQVTAEWAERL